MRGFSEVDVNRRYVAGALVSLSALTFGLSGAVQPALASAAAPTAGGTGSSLYGGYVVTSAPKASGKVSFTVPHVTCSTSTESGIFIGADVIGYGGVGAWEAGVDVMCVNAVPTYSVIFAWGGAIINSGDPI